MATPFAYTMTCDTDPSVSLADTSTVIVAGDVNVAPSAGLEIATAGGRLLGTVTCTAADVAVAPRSSVATAVSVYVPAGALAHTMPYGADASVLSNVPFA